MKNINKYIMNQYSRCSYFGKTDIQYIKHTHNLCNRFQNIPASAKHQTSYNEQVGKIVQSMLQKMGQTGNIVEHWYRSSIGTGREMVQVERWYPKAISRGFRGRTSSEYCFQLSEYISYR